MGFGVRRCAVLLCRHANEFHKKHTLGENTVDEMPVAEVRERVLRRIASPKGTARNAQEARDIDPLQLIRRKEPTAPVDIFDRLILNQARAFGKLPTRAGRISVPLN